MKISASTIKKEIDEKLLEQKRINAKIAQEQAKRKKLIDEITGRCLTAAMDGLNYVDLGFEFENLELIENLLTEKWIDIKYIDPEDYFSELIEEILSQRTPYQKEGIARVIEARCRTIKLSLNELRFCAANYELYEAILERVVSSLELINSNLPESITHCFKANKLYKDLKFNFDDLDDKKQISDLEIAKSEVKDDFRELAAIFKDLNIKNVPDAEDEYAKYLKWEKMTDEDVKYHITDDYSDATSLAYLASFHGQLFINAFKTAVENEMSLGQKSLQLTLFKYSSGHLLQFKNKAEMHTVYDEVALEHFFRKLGYSLDHQVSGDDEVDFLISWKV